MEQYNLARIQILDLHTVTVQKTWLPRREEVFLGVIYRRILGAPIQIFVYKNSLTVQTFVPADHLYYMHVLLYAHVLLLCIFFVYIISFL